MSPEAEMQDYSEIFGYEDARLDEIARELADTPYRRPSSEINDVVEKLQHSGSASVEGEGYRVIRDPNLFFRVVPDEHSHDRDISQAA